MGRNLSTIPKTVSTQDGQQLSQHFDITKMDKLLDSQRGKWARPVELFSLLGIEPSMNVADIGCGPGFFALPLALLVGDHGRVFAVDDSLEMLHKLTDRARMQGLASRLEIHECDAAETGLEDHSIDVLLCIFVYHEVADRERLLTEFTRVTKPKGKVVMVDWRKGIVSDIGPRDSVRLTAEQMVTPMKNAGLDVSELDFSNEYHVFVGRVPSESGS